MPLNMKLKTAGIYVFILLQHGFAAAQQKPLGLGLQLFSNIEQIVYCVPLPLKEFTELPGSERATHSFVNKKNSKSTIRLTGYYTTGTSIDTIYQQQKIEENEENGKIITQIELLKNKNCFYSIGYYSSFFNKYEFAEVTWVRKDEVVKLEIYYALKDKKIWYERLKIIIKNAFCR